MIIDMPQTTTTAVAKRLINLREEGGAVALGRVLTLIILTQEEAADDAIDAANDASREHPCRIIVLVTSPETSAGLDAQIRVGGDAGASEVIVLKASDDVYDHADTLIMPLLLPDAPIVSWWPQEAPDSPAKHAIGAISQRRITDSCRCQSPVDALERLRAAHSPGDTDLAWTRLTLWRGLLAATLDQAPFEPVESAIVEGNSGHPSVDLLAAWFAQQLNCPVTINRIDDAQAVTKAVLTRASGDIVLARPEGKVAILSQPGQPDHHIALPVRQLHECVAEELRRLVPDQVYSDVLTEGLPKVRK